MEEKVSINIRPTAEKINKYDVYVQGYTTYDIHEMHHNLDKEEAFKLFETLRSKYPDHCTCEFK